MSGTPSFHSESSGEEDFPVGVDSFSENAGNGTSTNADPQAEPMDGSEPLVENKYPSDVKLCNFLGEQFNLLKLAKGPTAFKDRVQSTYDYLCKMSGFQKMRASHLKKPNLASDSEAQLIGIDLSLIHI